MRRFFTVLAVIALTFCGAFSAQAGSVASAPSRPHSQTTARPVSLPQSDGLLDVLAAEFFESNLRLAQSRQIEAETAKRYLALDASERARFRADRKKLWREMSADQKQALRGVKRPSFANLDNAQKQTFRQIASETLGAAASGDRPGRDEI